MFKYLNYYTNKTLKIKIYKLSISLKQFKNEKQKESQKSDRTK
jgi:hypothetical protein